jgi:predicted DNA-binding antitoxin AbrB/MazE fold protein
MVHMTKAIYADGVLKPEEKLDLPDQQRVHVIIQPIEEQEQIDRDAALNQFFEHVSRSEFSYTGPMPTRDELHDRL